MLTLRGAQRSPSRVMNVIEFASRSQASLATNEDTERKKTFTNKIPSKTFRARLVTKYVGQLTAHLP